MSDMAQVKHFLYLDIPLVNSLFSQYHSGIITSISKATSTETSLRPSIGFDLKLVRGDLGTASSDTITSGENIDLHHYAYNLLENELLSTQDKDSDIVRLEGKIRVIDSRKVSSQFENLRDLISGFEAAMKIAPKSQENSTVIPQEMKAMTTKGKDIGKLIRQLSGDRILTYIGDDIIALDEESVISFGSPEFMCNGKLFDGKYVIVGIRSNVISDMTSGDADILLSLSLAFSQIQEMIKVSPIKPIAIYKVIE
ncbi:hypothetical protein AGMMS50284_4510 [Clostridia bacterium]|nr:hypothetical protein AGMMS50284_4510 [Clostridia bacterium]